MSLTDRPIDTSRSPPAPRPEYIQQSTQIHSTSYILTPRTHLTAQAAAVQPQTAHSRPWAARAQEEGEAAHPKAAQAAEELERHTVIPELERRAERRLERSIWGRQSGRVSAEAERPRRETKGGSNALRVVGLTGRVERIPVGGPLLGRRRAARRLLRWRRRRLRSSVGRRRGRRFARGKGSSDTRAVRGLLQAMGVGQLPDSFGAISAREQLT